MLSLVTDLTRDQFKAAGEWFGTTYRGLGYTQTSLAQASGVSTSTIRTLEAGGRKTGKDWVLPNPSPANLYRLANALAVPASEMGARFGKELSDVRQPEPPAQGGGVAADVQALREEIRSQRVLLERLLDRLPPP
jgi:transcriptional regulator with XRE-family HTH domain